MELIALLEELEHAIDGWLARAQDIPLDPTVIHDVTVSARRLEQIRIDLAYGRAHAPIPRPPSRILALISEAIREVSRLSADPYSADTADRIGSIGSSVVREVNR